MIATLKKQWFTIAIAIAIMLAYLISQTDFTLAAATANIITYSLIIGIFLLSGLTINSSQLVHSIKNWQLHLWIQFVSFIAFPLCVLLVGLIFSINIQANLIFIGFIVLACVPTTITSCVVFTRNAGGNEAAALFNATLGNILGIFITPFLIFLLLGEVIEINPWAAIKKLALLVILPFILGQIGRNLLQLQAPSLLAKTGGNWMVLGIMLIAFIAAFKSGIGLKGIDFFYIILLTLTLKLFMLTLSWQLCKYNARFSQADRKCLILTSTQKTLALGLPIITVLFAQHPNLAVLSFPIIAYHTVQLIIDGIVVGKMSTTPS